MAKITPIKTYRVDIVEYERGWGSKIDDTIYFDSEQEAKDYATEYNQTYNTDTEAPDWYMVAKYIGRMT